MLAIVGSAQTVALPVGGKAIEIDGIRDRGTGVDEEIIIFGLGIAEPELQTVEGKFARVESRSDAVIIRPDVKTGAVGCVPVPIFHCCVEIAVLAERQADIRPDCIDVAVTRLALPAVGRRKNPRIGRVERRGARNGLQSGQLSRAIERCDIFTETRGGTTAIALLLQLDVDNPGNGIGSILRRRPVAKHFNPVDGQPRNEVEVNRCRSAPDRAVDIEQRRDMAAFAVDKNQCLVRTEAAQRSRTQHIGTIGDGGLREIETGDQRVQNLVGFGQAGIGQRFRRNDVNRDSTVGNGASDAARSGDDDGFSGIDFLGCGGL